MRSAHTLRTRMAEWRYRRAADHLASRGFVGRVTFCNQKRLSFLVPKCYVVLWRKSGRWGTDLPRLRLSNHESNPRVDGIAPTTQPVARRVNRTFPTPLKTSSEYCRLNCITLPGVCSIREFLRVLLVPAVAVRGHQERSKKSGHAPQIFCASEPARRRQDRPGSTRGEDHRAVPYIGNGKVWCYHASRYTTTGCSAAFCVT